LQNVGKAGEQASMTRKSEKWGKQKKRGFPRRKTGASERVSKHKEEDWKEKSPSQGREKKKLLRKPSNHCKEKTVGMRGIAWDQGSRTLPNLRLAESDNVKNCSMKNKKKSAEG